jgi:hypothetical protein
MTKLDYVADNQTLVEVDKALELQQQLEKPRNYLGMSIIGHECWRKVFYDFRNVIKRKISASGIRAISDGFRQEDIMIERLRMLPFIELITTDVEDPTKQIAVEGLLSHFRGHLDGVIRGLKESSKWHVWENKAVNQKKFDLLNKLKAEKGEKSALKEWDIIYYAQAQCYCHYTELDRHYMTVETPGGRDYTSIRTDYNRKYAEMIIDKAQKLIFNNFDLPARISDKREFFQCGWCEFKGICHDGDIPDVHCKTCRYRDCIDGGKSMCLATDTIIEDTLLNVGCEKHVFNPALLPGVELIEHQEDGCSYQVEGKDFFFSNTNLTGFPEVKGRCDAIFTSKQLKEDIKNISNIDNKMVKEFKGTVIPQEQAKKAWEKSVKWKI